MSTGTPKNFWGIFLWKISYEKQSEINLPGVWNREAILKTRQDKTRQDKTRQDKTRQEKTRQESKNKESKNQRIKESKNQRIKESKNQRIKESKNQRILSVKNPEQSILASSRCHRSWLSTSIS